MSSQPPSTRTSPDTKVPRTGELALRRAIPANPNMKAIQIAMDNKEAILASIPEEHKEEGAKLYTSLLEEKTGLQTLLKYIKENNPDKLSIALASSLDTVAELELLQAPGLSFLLVCPFSVEERLAGCRYLAPEYAGDHPIFLLTKYHMCSLQLTSTLHLTYSYL
ncbi:Peptidyl-prolyl cis-trans isomerase CYP37 chloroplastic [Zea mays]|uniref:Peptidyl-prolyl cis-trans isomerase CYP37 chloroplastic n=1 Tax=Zea mays TaxID=4577 RepID=A0A1D6GC19_MAIZE|nr:Peptidyl-prolyl cis-trans isomerase CYP37 chloroplastic [Zea mays]